MQTIQVGILVGFCEPNLQGPKAGKASGPVGRVVGPVRGPLLGQAQGRGQAALQQTGGGHDRLLTAGQRRRFSLLQY